VRSGKASSNRINSRILSENIHPNKRIVLCWGIFKEAYDFSDIDEFIVHDMIFI
jgi:hypothetical protein